MLFIGWYKVIILSKKPRCAIISEFTNTVIKCKTYFKPCFAQENLIS